VLGFQVVCAIVYLLFSILYAIPVPVSRRGAAG
jgi:hypothetical protein